MSLLVFPNFPNSERQVREVQSSGEMARIFSVLASKISIARVARWLDLAAPVEDRRSYPIEYVPVQGLMSEMVDLSGPA